MKSALLPTLLAALPLVAASPGWGTDPPARGSSSGAPSAERVETTTAPSADLTRGLRLGGLRFAPPSDPRLAVPDLRLSFSAPTHRSPGLRSLLGVGPRPVELSRFQSTLKGVHLAASSVALLGSAAASYGLLDEKKALWAVGGAAALGALYGGTKGWGDAGWRASVAFSED